MSQDRHLLSLKRDGTRPWGTAADASVLILVVFAPALLYLPGLGFYSDDWGFLQVMEGVSSQSVVDRFVTMLPVTELRPAHALHLTLTHAVFGLTPLGHHLLNHLVMLLSLFMLVTVLWQLGVSRLLALTSALLFGLMPAYSTLRFWLSAQMINLSLLCYLVSLGLDLRVARARTRLWLGGRALSVMMATGSVLLYELCMPALLLNPFLAWWQRRQFADGLAERPAAAPSTGPFGGLPGRLQGTRPDARLAADLAVNVTIVFVAAAYKSVASPRSLPDEGVSVIGRLPRLARGVLNHHGVTHGIAEPLSLWTILTRYADLWTVLLAVLIGASLAAYLFRLAAVSPASSASMTPQQHRRACTRVIIIGLSVLWLGYLIFVSNDQFYFSAAGTANRVTQVGSLGVAIALAGAIGLLGTLLPGQQRQRAFLSGCVGVYGGAGALILMTIGGFWAEAYRRELAIVADIQRVMPAPRPGTTLLLDGECPYHGPATVFESPWDLEGALRLAYGDWTLRADIITPRLIIDDQAVSTWLTRPDSPAVHPYGEQLQLYNRRHEVILPVKSASDLQRYLNTFNPLWDSGCPFGWPGNGVTILPRS